MSRRVDDLLAALRRATLMTRNVERVDRGVTGPIPPRMPQAPAWPELKFCEGCSRPECDHGCAYGQKRKDEPVTRIVERLPPSIHEPIEPFGAPPPKETIAEAFRAAGQEVVAAIDQLVRTCEEARVEGLKLVEALYEHGDWHGDFLANYVTMQTEAAAVMRDAWKRQIEDLRTKRLALTQQVAPTQPTTPEGEKT